MALASKGIQLRVSEALKSPHANNWAEATNLKIKSLIDFNHLDPEEIDYEQEYVCIHATVDLRSNISMRKLLISSRQECVGVEMNWCKRAFI